MRTIRKLYGVALFALVLGISMELGGSALNHWVSVSNHGQMPVWVVSDDVGLFAAISPDHHRMTEGTHLRLLGDIIPYSYKDDDGSISTGMLSLGDVSLYLGVVMTVVASAVLVVLTLLVTARALLRAMKSAFQSSSGPLLAPRFPSAPPQVQGYATLVPFDW